MRFCLLSFLLVLLFPVTLMASGEAEVQDNIRFRITWLDRADLIIMEEQVIVVDFMVKFYQDRLYRPAWSRPAMVADLVQVLEEASDEGLFPHDYHLGALRFLHRLPDKNSSQLADLDVLASDAFLLYTFHRLQGKVNPENFDPNCFIERLESDPAEMLLMAVRSRDVRNSLEQASPKHIEYANLKKALARYRAMARSGGWDSIPQGESIKPGMNDPRIPAIRKRLAITGDLANAGYATHTRLDDTLVAAITDFQRRHGLYADGVLGRASIEVMNVPVQKRIEQIHVALERWRWLPQELSDFYIFVNIAKYDMVVVRNGNIVMRHVVIAGQPFRKTPVFSAKIRFLVFNPTWTIPPGILAKDILPAVRRNPGYLASRDIRVIDDQGRVVDPYSINWRSSGFRQYRFVQSPGSNNALGTVKFMFPNQHHVYLHDTPSKTLFSQADRALSSGCIRVSRPLDLAEYLLNDPEKWSMDKIKNLVATNRTTTVFLKEQPDVHIMYFTASARDDGRVYFLRDVYNLDQEVWSALHVPVYEMDEIK